MNQINKLTITTEKTNRGWTLISGNLIFLENKENGMFFTNGLSLTRVTKIVFEKKEDEILKLGESWIKRYVKFYPETKPFINENITCKSKTKEIH